MFRQKKQTNLLCAVVNPEHEQQCNEVETCKNVLAQVDVHPMVCKIIQSCEDVDKPSWIPATTRGLIKTGGLHKRHAGQSQLKSCGTHTNGPVSPFSWV